MKNINRVLSMVLALMLLVTLAVPAMADEVPAQPELVQVPTTGEFSITINNAAAGHTYEAYMIFYGSHHQIASATDPLLTDIVWGNGVTAYQGAAVQTGAVAGEIAATLTDNNIIAFSKALTLSAAPLKSATVAEGANSCVIDGLPSGYYLVKDQYKFTDNDNEAYTAYIIKVAGHAVASLKVNLPTLEKKVSDINDSENTAPDTHKISADHDIGDEVPFHIHVNVGSNITDYTTYEMVVTDTMSKGLTFNEDSVVVTLKNTTLGAEHYDIDSVKNGDDTIITFTFSDLIAAGVSNSDTLAIDYTATLNENAVVGNPGNPNKAYLEYSNNPYNVDSKGKTPESVVKVFTYQITVNKTDGHNAALNGATFKLSKLGVDGNWTVVEEIVGENFNVFEFKGLDDGTYMLEETEAPDGYNTIKPLRFDLVADHSTDVEVTNLTATALGGSGTVFAPAEEGSIGILSTTIVNEMGATLPTTGGAGTTMLYVVGAVLVLAAVVLLITKKRMADAE